MVVIDFETYYSKEFSLSKITTEEYIRSPQFEVIGVCVKEDDGPVEWITGTLEEIKAGSTTSPSSAATTRRSTVPS